VRITVNHRKLLVIVHTDTKLCHLWTHAGRDVVGRSSCHAVRRQTFAIGHQVTAPVNSLAVSCWSRGWIQRTRSSQ